MTGAELRKLRERSGLSYVQFGEAIGYGGKRRNIARRMRRMEGLGSDHIPEYVVENARSFEARLIALEAKWSAQDPRDPDYSRSGMFQTHNCWKCGDGARPCVAGGPHRCEYPHARND